ncbi:hypothetical protein FB451DRAFT_1043079, partial [Mycena latifolia]
HLDQGWVCSPTSDLLLWLPNPNRLGLWTPRTKRVIGQQQSLILFHNSVHGTDWTNCYLHQ